MFLQSLVVNGVRVALDLGTDWRGREVLFVAIGDARASFWSWEFDAARVWIKQAIEQAHASTVPSCAA